MKHNLYLVRRFCKMMNKIFSRLVPDKKCVVCFLDICAGTATLIRLQHVEVFNDFVEAKIVVFESHVQS